MTSTSNARPFAVVTGASSGIGLELARCCAEHGFDLLVVADDAAIHDVVPGLAMKGAAVEALQADLATQAGVDRLDTAIGGRPVAALMANAGRGLGHGFLDQDFIEVRKVIDTNITGTLDLIQRVARGMRTRASGRILVTGSIAGLMPGAFQAVYNGTKAFLDSFAVGVRDELKDSGVTVTVLMPGPTDTEFFASADMLDTKMGRMKKDDPADVAKAGFEAMMKGEADVVSGLKNKVMAAMAHVTPSSVLAEAHRKLSEPGGASDA